MTFLSRLNGEETKAKELEVEGDLMSLSPPDFILWANKQTPHRLTEADHTAVKTSGISGYAFLELGTYDFLMECGVCRSSSALLSRVERNFLRAKRVNDCALFPDSPTSEVGRDCTVNPLRKAPSTISN
jgi:hypothetical protein